MSDGVGSCARGAAMRSDISDLSVRDPIGLLWHGLVLVVLLVCLLPLDPDSPVLSFGLGGIFDGHLQNLPQQFYLLIKGAILWVPLGALAGLVNRGRQARLIAIAALPVLLFLAMPQLTESRLRDLLELLSLFPGLALGLWLGVGSRLLAKAPVASAPVASATQSSSDRLSQLVTGSLETPPALQMPVNSSAHHGSSELSAGHNFTEAVAPDQGQGGYRAPGWTGRILGLVLLAVAVAALFGFSRWNWLLASGLVLYAGLLWIWPRTWLVALPATLPLLDLAPWTGRFFLDEFDMLMLVTVGMLLLRKDGREQGGLPPLTGPLIALFAATLLASTVLHLLPLSPIDANAFSSYWSPYNAVRVLKGFVWGGLVFLWLRRARLNDATTLRLLALGMGLGLLGVGLVGAWERWLYTGLGEDGRAYRIVATFSSMHTGGGHIEAWLVAALPFLWLGAFRLRDLALAGPLAILTAYVTLYTVSRGGVLAMGVVLALLLAASVRVVWRAGVLRFAAPVALLLAVATVLAVGLSGGYFQQRLSTVGQDWQTRVEHWQRALGMMDDGIVAGLFGMGPGSFPRVWLARGPLDNQPATYGFATDKGNIWLRLGAGETLYYAQRVPARADQTYRLSLNVRSDADQARIDTPLCEKQLLNSRRCVWFGFDVPGDGQWHGITHTFSSGEVGGRGLFDHLPTEFVLRHAGRGGVIEVDDVQLLDEAGRNLLCNGDFSHGADCWFFKTHSHLPWHIKNLWVHLYFELGALGLALFAGLSLLALARLSRAAWRGEKAAWVLLASLAGLLTVGMFDSLLDAPRLAILLVAFTLLGAGTPWGRGKTAT